MEFDLFAGPLVEHMSLSGSDVHRVLMTTALLHGLGHLEFALVNILGLFEFEHLALSHLLVSLDRLAEQTAAEAARIYHFIGDVILVRIETLQAELGRVRRGIISLVVVRVATSHDGDHSAEHQASLGKDSSSTAVLRAS